MENLNYGRINHVKYDEQNIYKGENIQKKKKENKRKVK